MDHKLIRGWNERVRNGDSVIHVGDSAVARDANYPDSSEPEALRPPQLWEESAGTPPRLGLVSDLLSARGLHRRGLGKPPGNVLTPRSTQVSS
jgi:hypothetical protein